MIKDIPSRPGARRVKAWIAEGEHLRQDFKHSVSDARKIARSLSAFANHSGGRLLIGVKDNGVIAGVRNEEDVYVVETAARIYCTPEVEVKFQAYSIDTGLTVIAAETEAAAEKPVYVKEVGNRLRAFYRVADENIAAHPLLVASWERRRCPRPLVMGDAHSALIKLLHYHGSFAADIRAIAVALHIAEHTAAAIVAETAAAGAIVFSYRNSAFFISPA